jgi:hypothetical protein
MNERNKCEKFCIVVKNVIPPKAPVIPTKVGIQSGSPFPDFSRTSFTGMSWIPVCTGMTTERFRSGF